MNPVVILPSDANYKGSLFNPKPEILYPNTTISLSPDLNNPKIFTFRDASIFEKVIDPSGPILRIERYSFSLAHVYFLNDQGVKVAVPKSFSIFDTTNNVEIKKVSNTESFFLCWTDNYIFSYYSSQILKLSNTREWSIS